MVCDLYGMILWNASPTLLICKYVAELHRLLSGQQYTLSACGQLWLLSSHDYLFTLHIPTLAICQHCWVDMSAMYIYNNICRTNMIIIHMYVTCYVNTSLYDWPHWVRPLPLQLCNNQPNRISDDTGPSATCHWVVITPSIHHITWMGWPSSSAGRFLPPLAWVMEAPHTPCALVTAVWAMGATLTEPSQYG